MIRWVPLVVILVLVGLAFVGDQVRAYDMAQQVRCSYVLAEQKLHAADVILIGPSRVRRGLDPDFIEALLAENGYVASVDRLSLNLPQFSQFFPLLNRYLKNRGAPRIAYLQLGYNFKPERQDSWDLPINPPRNLAFGSLSDLLEVQNGAPLNDFGKVLPRQLHEKAQNLAAAWLTRVEMSIFSGLRYLPKRLTGQMPDCKGDLLRGTGQFKLPVNGMTVEEAEAKTYVAPDTELLKQWKDEAEDFLPLDPGAPWRRAETAQLTRLVDLLQTEDVEVVLLIMPKIGQRTVVEATRKKIESVFPGIDIYFPMDAYDGELEDQIATSFTDTHHVNTFGAIYLSKALAADLLERLSAK